MTWTDIPAGTTLDAATLADLASYAVRPSATKASDLPRASTTSESADPDLSILLPANRTYLVEAGCIISSAANAAGDFKIGFEWTNSATVTILGLGLSAAGLASGTITDLEGVAQHATSSPTTGISYGASTTPTTVLRRMRVVTGGSDVIFTVRWAQQSSSLSATNLLTGSWLVGERMNV